MKNAMSSKLSHKIIILRVFKRKTVFRIPDFWKFQK